MIEYSALIFLVICACAVFIATFSGWFMKRLLHAPLTADPGIIIVSVVVAVSGLVAIQFIDTDLVKLMETDLIPLFQILIILAVAIIGYVVGHYLGPSENTVRLWTRDKEGVGHITEVTFWIKDKIAYLPPKKMCHSLAAMKGHRGILDIDLSRPYFAAELIIDTKEVDETIKDIIPIASSSPSSTTVGFLRFGSKRTKNEDGTVTKTPRYLLEAVIESQKHVPADRVYQKFDEFWYDITVVKKSTADAASTRAQMQRLELTMEEKFFEEVVAHVRRMVSFNIDSAQLPKDLEEGVAQEIERRKEKQKETST